MASLAVSGSLLAVIVGLMFFMEGLKLGLMPFGTVIGATLPRRSSLPVVLIITLLLGIGVAFAEPAISALKMAGQNAAVGRARPGDVVVIAGKGHETGQEIAGVVHPFSDHDELRAAIWARLEKGSG